MSYGLRTWRQDGTLVVDSQTHIGALFVEVYQVPGGAQTITRGYSAFPGRQGFAIFGATTSFAYNEVTVSWSYSAGYPTLTITRVVPDGATSQYIPVFVFIN